jgi:prevent-host-death family protein
MTESADEPTPVVREVAASDMKNGWYDYLELVSTNHQEIVLTRYGKPIAKLVPYEGETETRRLFGSMKGTVTVLGDIVSPLDLDWEALH